MDILDTIIEYKRKEVEEMKQSVPQSFLLDQIEKGDLSICPSMKASLMKTGYGIIAEFKRKSPSKGWINESAKPEVIPVSYQQNGASALSILTDNKFFGGSDRFIRKARTSGVTLPVLYKNFIVDEYQVYEARVCGASAILLIAACLTKEECRQLITLAHQLGMEVLLEIHSIAELDYIDLLPDMCGVNNRNLGTFHTDVENSFRLADKLPVGICKISESGISNPHTVAELISVGYSGFLIGETFMRSTSPGDALKEFIEDVERIKEKRTAV